MDIETNTPQNIVEEILKSYEDIYSIKIKCLACKETGFMKYSKPIIDGKKLKIGERSYPLELIEKITIRYRICGVKCETEYCVKVNYLKQYLNDEANKILHEFFGEKIYK